MLFREKINNEFIIYFTRIVFKDFGIWNGWQLPLTSADKRSFPEGKIWVRLCKSRTVYPLLCAPSRQARMQWGSERSGESSKTRRSLSRCPYLKLSISGCRISMRIFIFLTAHFLSSSVILPSFFSIYNLAQLLPQSF